MNASSVSAEYNWFFWVLVVVCGAVAVAIACVVIYSALRYHRKREDELPPPSINTSVPMETAWTVIPLFIFMGMFAFGAKLYFDIERPPDDALQVYIVAKQWMWKAQQLDGVREINEMHVPVGQSIKLLMISQDVIHSFYVPAFRIKQDVLPGRYTSIWFRATKPGKYHLFCAEYCGTNHSQMIGWIYALDRQQYQQWVQQGAGEGSLASSGEKLFHQYACANCHHFDGHGNCPNLQGLYHSTVNLNDGTTVSADESYIRRKLFDPRATTVLGYDKNMMPDFSHLLTEDDVIELIAFIRSLAAAPTQPSSSGTTPHSYGNQPGIAYPDAPPIVNHTPGVH
jgi:cytochrome c oxidase subunit II